MKNLMPFKLNIFYTVAKSPVELSPEEIHEKLKIDYGKEAQCNLKMIQGHLDSFVCVDIMRNTREEIDVQGNLLLKYEITPFGKTRIKFLPEAEYKELQALYTK